MRKAAWRARAAISRRNHLVPVPVVADLDALNAFLLNGSRADEARVLDGRTEPVGAAMVAERDHLSARVAEGFDLADVTFPLVDKQGCAMVKTNAYSVPVRTSSRVEARAYPLHVEIWHSGRRVARHERCHRRRQHVLDLEHCGGCHDHSLGAGLAGRGPAKGAAHGRRRPLAPDRGVPGRDPVRG